MVRKPFWFLLLLALSVVVAAVAALAATDSSSNLTKALDAQRQLTTQHPDDPGIWNDYGNLLLLDHRSDEAESAYRHAVELDPKKVSALFNLGLLERQRGRLKDAQKLFSQVVAIEPEHAWAHYEIGAVYEAEKRPGKAIDAYSRAFSLDPQLAFADVNPQVVDSKLVTQAMLKAYRQDGRPADGPKVYEDPTRIAGLLVPPPQAPAADATDTAAKPDAKTQATAPGAAVPGAKAPGAGVPGMAGAGQGTVLREGNIDRGSPVGQALPPGQTRQPRAITPPSRTPGRPGSLQPQQQNWQRPIPNVDEDEEQNGPANVVPPPPPSPPPTGVIYTPGIPSSGRLDVRLIPGRPSRPAERLAALGSAQSRG
ncbi:MAG TPA: tetratricopeptide repeat protein [Thermoanaerobaculia bacterium]|nr:tetratricopeptide repeat protein [Thermoanaerobaculia bacterium]